MGCYPKNDNPPTFILVERDDIDQEPSIEDFDYKTPESLLAHIKIQTPENNTGAFIAVYKLVEGIHTTTAHIKTP